MREHHAGVEDPFEFDAVAPQAVEHGHEDLALDVGQHLVADRGRGAVGTHAAGHGAGVAFIDGFVVLCGFHQIDVPAIDERHHADFRAGHEFFDDDAGTRIAEDFLAHRVIDGVERFAFAVADADALALGQAGGFHHDRLAVHFDVLLGGIGIGEAAGFRRGDRLRAHKLFGEPFIAFQLGGFHAGAEDLEAELLQAIGQAGGERVFRADDDQIDRVVFGEAFDATEVHDIDLEAIRHLRHAGVAREAEEALNFGRLAELPRQGVLAAARADQ